VIDPNEIKKMLHAYALGCLEREDLIKLKDHINSGGEINWAELGEFQNLAALLPIILNIEEPPPHVKNNVARKLYRIRDEIREKKYEALKTKEPDKFKISQPPKEEPPPKNEVKRETPTPKKILKDDDELVKKEPVKFRFNEAELKKNEENAEKPEQKEEAAFEAEEKTEADYEAVEGDVFIDSETAVSDEILEEIITKHGEGNSNIKEFEAVTPLKNSPNIFEKTETSIIEKEPESQKREDLLDYSLPPVRAEEDKFQKKFGKKFFKKNPYKKQSEIPYFLLFVIVFLLAAIGYFYFKSTALENRYKAELAETNSDLKNLLVQLTAHEELQNLIEQKETRLLNMEGNSSEMSAKLIINLNSNNGFIQLSKLPQPELKNVYQLWAELRGSYYSLGIFHPDKKIEYYSFRIPSIQSANDLNFILTEEKLEGSKIPEGRPLLKGSLK
jgi:hypothetical protein